MGLPTATVQMKGPDGLTQISSHVRAVVTLFFHHFPQVVCGTMGLPTATVQMKGPDGLTRIGVGVGTGPVDAAYKAIDSLVDVDAELVDYGVNSVTEGYAAVAC